MLSGAYRRIPNNLKEIINTEIQLYIVYPCKFRILTVSSAQE